MASALQPLRFLTVTARTQHTATVIFVHGLGDTGAGWKPVADMFREDSALSHVKWVLPHAPVVPVTANMGMEMPSWFDILSFGFDCPEDETGMLKTVQSLNELIMAEVDAGIPSNRIVVGGFSQGGTMSILAGLTNKHKLAGVVALSSWLPLQHKFKAMTSEYAKSTSIFWGHGTADPLVKYQFGVDSVEFLRSEVGIPDASLAAPTNGILFMAYQGVQHSTNQRELDDLREWLGKILPKEFD